MDLKKKVAILQSNYIPWKGYFDLINSVDEFIFYDDVQYTKNDWRNRNKIKTQNGLMWLTIPVKHENLNQKIKDTEIAYTNWNRKHWNAISLNYSKARYFKQYKELFEEVYLGITTKNLAEVNYVFIKLICNILNIHTKLSYSTNFKPAIGRVERLVDLCTQAGAGCYISGPSAKNYLNEELFRQEGIQVEYVDYSNYPEYNQLHGPFVHEVSIVDLILNEGPHSMNYLKCSRMNYSLRVS